MSSSAETTAFYPAGPHISPEDLLLHTLELLSAGEKQAIEGHLATCAACKEELAEVRADVGAYALAAVESNMVEVPAGSRERLLAAVEGAKKKVGVRENAPVMIAAAGESRVQNGSDPRQVRSGAPVEMGRRSPVTAWLGWAVAAGLLVVVGRFYQVNLDVQKELHAKDAQIASLAVDSDRAREVLSALTAPEAQRVTLSLTKAPPAPQPTGRATYLPSRGTLIFVASHLAQLPAGKTYELWLIPTDGTAPRAAGIFRPDESGNANVVAPELSAHLAAKAFGVTVEPEGGSATPTMPILMAGS